ncbi:uncharacterized protein LOC105283118 isoform X2 [Ooceraea biroi]|uniref:uncharacterized protein LOC105283118 isoform X2 n=1 Tax=Ooceraea biroi TaxID=2015173 RepID=UPI0009716DF2|nr:uncharacterized protein LOC105283118 isoform X2 [Ooceraea biroi]
MVSQFRLDSLHLVYLGVFKRLITTWCKWNGMWKLNRMTITAISRTLECISIYCPQDLTRKPRSLEELKFFKGTEFRRLCLYDGILVFKDFVNENIYKHFLLLHSAIYILSHPILVHSMSDYANQLLRTFITHAATIYGKKFVVYNVHALSHLAEECALHGHLESFSAFKYENFLKSIKCLLQSGYKPLHQVANRDLERNISVPIILENNVVLQIGKKDSCFILITDEVIILEDTVHIENRIFLVGKQFQQSKDFYTYPFPSSTLSILSVSQLNENVRILSMSEIKAKCWLIPDHNSFLCVPLLHTFPVFQALQSS